LRGAPARDGGSELGWGAADRVPHEEDLNVAGFIPPVVDVIASLGHQDAPDETTASRRVPLTFVVRAIT
jgi:hypothetical protein